MQPQPLCFFAFTVTSLEIVPLDTLEVRAIPDFVRTARTGGCGQLYTSTSCPILSVPEDRLHPALQCGA
jgi:hypothetical protein